VNRYDFTGTLPIYTTGGLKIATEYNRIVHGGRGAYVEFLDEQIIKENLVIPEGSEWRLDPKHPVYNQCYFVLHNPKGEKTRVYHQRKTVDYADYVIGRWYIAPKGLQGFEVVGKYDNN